MSSLFAKILLWFWSTLVITVIGAALISALTMNEDDSDRGAPMTRLMNLQLAEARFAFEKGGPQALQSFLGNLDRIFGAQAVLTDLAARDVLTGQDRSDLLRNARRPRVRPVLRFFRPAGRPTPRFASDGRYYLFVVFDRPRLGAWFLTPEHLFVLGFAALMCYWLAFHLTSPLRDLQKAVERFGRGDFSSRVNSTRRDELGRLARTFDRMAGRIETLLAAERRLLLDVSHELRSPLARLGVAVELARTGDDPHAALDRIQKESDRLNALVGQLLQVTRAEGDPASLNREPLRLDTLVAQVVDDAGIEAAARRCRLEFTSHDPALVKGDPELLRRAVENVIRNAIRYAPPDSAVEVSMSLNGGKALMRVRDHGPGVPEQALPHIFDAFYRVESDRGRLSGGAGLGLSIARRALQLHQGSIRARNTQPGLEVELEVPASPELPDAESAKSEPAGAPHHHA